MRNVIITGANSGLGFEAARKIAAHEDYRLVLACRNAEKAEAAVAQIVSETGNKNVTTITLDTASLDSVRAAADAYKDAGFGPIYALLLNAGISGMHEGTTVDGMDIVFETNHLGHFLLANLLLDQMDEQGKVISTTSDMHDSPMGKMVWPGTEALAYADGSKVNLRMRYSYSKLANIYFIHELARRLEEQGSSVSANAFNPGMMQTNFAKTNRAHVAMVKHTMPHRLGDLEKSSDALAELVLDDTLATTSANYYDRSTTAVPSSELSYNDENARELWEASERLCGLP